MILPYHRPPTVEIRTAATETAGVRLLVRREDLNHPMVSGNKWWKLKLNLEAIQAEGKGTVLTFGGAYSNHIYATAAAARQLGIQSIGVIRGEKIEPLNPTLHFATQQGMHLHFISREHYRRKSNPEFIRDFARTYGDFYLLPEGGTNELAVRGCMELGTELGRDYDFIVLAVGTGGTMAGIIAALAGEKYVLGVTVLKNGEFLNNEITQMTAALGVAQSNWRLLTAYHHGGYARTNAVLESFIRDMDEIHNLPLDHVYTGKMMWALMREVELGSFPRGSTILALHTGGLQGATVHRAH